MLKYLIITKEGDYISSSKNIRKHFLKTNGSGIMIYNKDGVLINSAHRTDAGKVIVHGGKFYDGEPRQWASNFIKNNKEGAMVEDASALSYSKERFF